MPRGEDREHDKEIFDEISAIFFLPKLMTDSYRFKKLEKYQVG